MSAEVTIRIVDKITPKDSRWLDRIVKEAKGIADLTPMESPEGIAGQYILCKGDKVRRLFDLTEVGLEGNIKIFEITKAKKKYFTVSKKILEKFKPI